jgi:ligand-binding sensor domain-containing protein/two-component sensor histidine kinase
MALLLVIVTLSLRSSALDPHQFISQYSHTAWRVQDGVFLAGVSNVVQTKDGYLWVGTRNGLFRFDGVRFVPWEQISESKEVVRDVYVLHAAEDGSLWIGYATRLIRWKGGVASVFDLPNRPQQIADLPDSSVWVAMTRVTTSDKGPLCRIKADTVTCYGAKEGVTLSHYPCVAAARNGKLWIGDETDVLLWDPGTHLAEHFGQPLPHRSPDASWLSFLWEDVDGSLWAGARGSGAAAGLAHLVNHQWQPLHGKNFDTHALDTHAMEIMSFFHDHDGTIWVGTRKDGLLRIADSHVERYNSTQGLTGDLVRSILEDREGDLWIGTSKGLDKLRNFQVKSFTKTEGLSSEDVGAVAASTGGVISIQNDDELDQVQLGDTLTVKTLQQRPPGQVRTMFSDSRGRLWVQIRHDFYVVDHGRWTRIRLRYFEGQADIEDIAESDGDIIATAFPQKVQEVYLLRIRGEELIDQIPLSTVIGKVYVRTMAGAPDGTIWLLLSNGSIEHWKAGVFTKLDSGPPLKPVARLAIGHEGLGFVGTRDGIVVLSNTRRQLLTTANGLPCNRTYEIRESKTGDVWLYSECGLVQIPAMQFQQWWKDSRIPIHPRLLDRYDGAFPALSTFAQASAESPDGRLWFANDDLLQMIDAPHLTRNDVRPPVHVENLLVNGSISPGASLDLKHGAKSIEIDYTALSLAVPEKVQFKYQLIGWDKDWQNAGERRHAFYTNLPPRQYVFRVVACNNDGVWNEEGDTIRFRIEPTFWQTGWFKALAVLAGFGALWLLIKFRMRLIYERMRDRWAARIAERERIARELHDTFLQGIQGLLLHFSTAARSMPPESSARKSIEESLNQSNQIMLTGRRLVEDLRNTSRAVTLSEELEAIGRGFQGLYATDFSVSSSGKEPPLNPVVADELFKVGREAISNAFHHAQATSIQVELEYRDRDLKLLIRDDGVGIDERLLIEGKKMGHWGLPGMRERVAQLNGNIRFKSQGGIGTTVEVKIPASRAYRRKQFRLPRWLSLMGENDGYLE